MRWLTILFVVAVVALSSCSVEARRLSCAKRADVLSQLKTKFGEVPVANGISEGSLVELLTSKDGATWTIIVTSPRGISCLHGSGQGWRAIEVMPGERV